MIGYLVSAAIGFFVLHLIVPEKEGMGPLTRLWCSIAAGFGVASLILFALLLSPIQDVRMALIIIESTVLVCTGAAALALRRIHWKAPAMDFFRDIVKDRFALVLAACLCFGLIASLIYFFMYAQVGPHGGWDTITIWNFRARGLFRGRDMLSHVFSPLLTFDHHADYPLFIPLTVLHGWLYAGKETFIAPITVSFIFTYGTLAVLMESIYRHRGTMGALIGGCTLLGIQVFHHTGAIQYADMPLAFFYLAAVVPVYDFMSSGKRSSLILAGIFTAMAAWTKNEGLSFLAAAALAWGVHSLFLFRDGKRPLLRFLREAFFFMLGALPFVTAIAVFKKTFPIANDIVGNGGTKFIGYITDIGRYRMIGGLFTGYFFQTRLYTIIPVMIIVLLCALGLRKRSPREKMYALPVALMV
ncbi:MAG: hypothetical protein AABZ39_13300, partial [Spirochaetota bacterium]